jgi:hypothetical protein
MRTFKPDAMNADRLGMMSWTLGRWKQTSMFFSWLDLFVLLLLVDCFLEIKDSAFRYVGFGGYN